MGFYAFRKWTVLVFNLILLVVGATFIGYGTKYTIDDDLIQAIPSSHHYFTFIPGLLIGVGSITILIALFGTLGVFRKNTLLLTIHTIILLVIFVLNIVLGIVTFWEVNDQNRLFSNINKTLDDLFKSENQTQLIDSLQSELECCGTYGPKFWPRVPKSCCDGADCNKLVYTDGCQNEYYYFLVGFCYLMGITMLVLSVIHVFAATLSMSLANAIRNKTRRYGRYTK